MHKIKSIISICLVSIILTACKNPFEKKFFSDEFCWSDELKQAEAKNIKDNIQNYMIESINTSRIQNGESFSDSEKENIKKLILVNTSDHYLKSTHQDGNSIDCGANVELIVNPVRKDMKTVNVKNKIEFTANRSKDGFVLIISDEGLLQLKSKLVEAIDNGLKLSEQLSETSFASDSQISKENQESDLNFLVGKMPSDMIKDSRVLTALPKAISNDDLLKIDERFDVAPVIERSNGYIVMSGCKAHNCNSDAAIIVFNPKTHDNYVIYAENLDAYHGKPNVKYFSNNSSDPSEVKPIIEFLNEYGISPSSITTS